MPLPILNIIPFSGYAEWTSVIPSLYWNVYSAEQRMKALCEFQSKSDQYMDYVAETVNKYSRELDEDVAREIQKLETELANMWDELVKLLMETGEGSLDWDVQKGKYLPSVEAMRDMFNDVTVHSLTIEELDALDIDVSELAESGLNVRGLAVMSRWLVNHSEPLYPPYRI